MTVFCYQVDEIRLYKRRELSRVSVKVASTGWTVLGSGPARGMIFCMCPNRADLRQTIR